MFSGESAMRETRRRVGEVDDPAVTQVFSEPRTVHFSDHPVVRRMRMFFEEAADVLVASHTSNSRGRHELLPRVGRLRQKDLADVLDKFYIMRATGERARKARVRAEILM